MRQAKFKTLLIAMVGLACTALLTTTQAQVNISVGAEPDCPYGYYDVSPYGCAPSGYYGPEWFTGGVFIGAGPWFHGQSNFHGKVDNRFDQQKGYKGPTPNPGEKAEPSKRIVQARFKGNEVHDGQGKVVGGKR
jgi:hypothetical protein